METIETTPFAPSNYNLIVSFASITRVLAVSFTKPSDSLSYFVQVMDRYLVYSTVTEESDPEMTEILTHILADMYEEYVQFRAFVELFCREDVFHRDYAPDYNASFSVHNFLAHNPGSHHHVTAIQRGAQKASEFRLANQVPTLISYERISTLAFTLRDVFTGLSDGQGLDPLS